MMVLDAAGEAYFVGNTQIFVFDDIAGADANTTPSRDIKGDAATFIGPNSAIAVD